MTSSSGWSKGHEKGLVCFPLAASWRSSRSARGFRRCILHLKLQPMTQWPKVSPYPTFSQYIDVIGCYQKMKEHVRRIERHGTYRMKQVYKMHNIYVHKALCFMFQEFHKTYFRKHGLRHSKASTSDVVRRSHLSHLSRWLWNHSSTGSTGTTFGLSLWPWDSLMIMNGYDSLRPCHACILVPNKSTDTHSKILSHKSSLK